MSPDNHTFEKDHGPIEKDREPIANDRGWYKYGVAALLGEMGIAIAVCGYSLFMAFAGIGGFPGK